MSSDVEHFYVRRSEPLGPLLPNDVRWEHDEEEHVAGGDEWQLLIYDPEPVKAEQIPPDLRAALPDLRFTINASIEPINPPDEAWQLLDSVFDAVGGALGGATYEIRTGRVIAWRDGQRIEPSSR
jgi:hypothetical protein